MHNEDAERAVTRRAERSRRRRGEKPGAESCQCTKCGRTFRAVPWGKCRDGLELNSGLGSCLGTLVPVRQIGCVKKLLDRDEDLVEEALTCACGAIVEPRATSAPNEMRRPGQGFTAWAVECPSCGRRGPIVWDEWRGSGARRARDLFLEDMPPANAESVQDPGGCSIEGPDGLLYGHGLAAVPPELDEVEVFLDRRGGQWIRANRSAQDRSLWTGDGPLWINPESRWREIREAREEPETGPVACASFAEAFTGALSRLRKAPETLQQAVFDRFRFDEQARNDVDWFLSFFRQPAPSTVWVVSSPRGVEGVYTKEERAREVRDESEGWMCSVHVATDGPLFKHPQKVIEIDGHSVHPEDVVRLVRHKGPAIFGVGVVMKEGDNFVVRDEDVEGLYHDIVRKLGWKSVYIEDAPRPETKAEEDTVTLRAFGQALNRICDALGMPGSPSLVTAVPERVEEVMEEHSDIKTIARDAGFGNLSLTEAVSGLVKLSQQRGEDLKRSQERIGKVCASADAWRNNADVAYDDLRRIAKALGLDPEPDADAIVQAIEKLTKDVEAYAFELGRALRQRDGESLTPYERIGLMLDGLIAMESEDGFQLSRQHTNAKLGLARLQEHLEAGGLRRSIHRFSEEILDACAPRGASETTKAERVEVPGDPRELTLESFPVVHPGDVMLSAGPLHYAPEDEDNDQ